MNAGGKSEKKHVSEQRNTSGKIEKKHVSRNIEKKLEKKYASEQRNATGLLLRYQMRAQLIEADQM
jgi:hypothetical protein